MDITTMIEAIRERDRIAGAIADRLIDEGRFSAEDEAAMDGDRDLRTAVEDEITNHGVVLVGDSYKPVETQSSVVLDRWVIQLMAARRRRDALISAVFDAQVRWDAVVNPILDDLFGSEG
jgi:hypothetical protein